MLVSAFTSYHLKKARLPSSSRRGWGWSEDKMTNELYLRNDDRQTEQSKRTEGGSAR